MYKFKTNIKKRFWNVLELSESDWTSDIMNGAHDRHFNEIDNKLRKMGYNIKTHKESYNPEYMSSSWTHPNGGKVTFGVEYRKPNRLTLSYKKENYDNDDSQKEAGVSHNFETYGPHAYGTSIENEQKLFGNAKTVFFKKLKRIHTLYEHNLNEIETKNKILFVSPWNDELEDLDYSKTIARTHKIENDGRKNTKKRSGSQVRKQVRARKAKEDSESVSRMLRQLFAPFKPKLEEAMEWGPSSALLKLYSNLSDAKEHAKAEAEKHVEEYKKHPKGSELFRHHYRNAWDWGNTHDGIVKVMNSLKKSFPYEQLNEMKTSRGLYVFRHYQDNDSDKPLKSSYVTRSWKNSWQNVHRDHNRKKRTGSQIMKDLQSDKEKRYEDTILKIYGPELAPYVPRPKKY